MISFFKVGGASSTSASTLNCQVRNFFSQPGMWVAILKLVLYNRFHLAFFCPGTDPMKTCKLVNLNISVV